MIVRYYHKNLDLIAGLRIQIDRKAVFADAAFEFITEHFGLRSCRDERKVRLLELKALGKP